MPDMSAEAIDRQMPVVETLDDLAAMNAADRYGRRFELSPEGALSVMPPSDFQHAKIASRLCAWFFAAGWPADQVLQAVGLRIPGPDGDGGRIPDVTVWAQAVPDMVWSNLKDLLLAIEIVSPSSAAMDQVVKRAEYAQAGISRYWVVDRDPALTVTLYQLGADGHYVEHVKMPLDWLLNTPAAEHLD
jgi:Uma2 family endonuclease